MTTYHSVYEKAAHAIIDRVGKQIIIGVPLGLGKPIGLLNSLYEIALKEPSVQLTIITGLTLSRPTLTTELEKNFVEPILDRILKNYEDPLYEKARVQQTLPKNINVIEFFLLSGKYIHNAYVQQNYISSTYTNVVRDVSQRSINVIAQQVAHSKINTDEYSLSCNTDLFHGTVDYLLSAEKEGKKIAIVAEVNANLPFMMGEDAIIAAPLFTDIIDTKQYRALFALPREALTECDHMLGLYTSCLIEDNGCLQIGIGKHSQSVASALILRDQNNALYRDVFRKISFQEKFGKIKHFLDPFKEGIYASTEMFSDEYMQLYLENILKKRVYDHAGLQRLLNEKIITDHITTKTLDILLENNIIQAYLTQSDFDFLKKFGILISEIRFENNKLILKNGEIIPADISETEIKQIINSSSLGTRLKSGKMIHAGFFLGSLDFYKNLHELPQEALDGIAMTSVARTNALSWSYELAKLQRQNARMINYAMMITLGGAVISDGLKDLQEVSGVGGQFDFVTMAEQLPNARSIINCRSTRQTQKGLKSNIVWEYANITIPRYLRDIIITEYGIADCRSKTDSEVIEAILNITDSRFQDELLAQAKKSGKIARDFEIKKEFRNNFPERYESVIRELQTKGYCKSYPFGCDLTSEEIVLEQALLFLKKSSRIQIVYIVIRSLFYFRKDAHFAVFLQRMHLNSPKTIKQFIYKQMLKYIIGCKLN